MTPRATLLGWLGSATTAAVLLIGVAVLGMAQSDVVPIVLDLGQRPPAAPAIAAIAEFAPPAVVEHHVVEHHKAEATTEAQLKAPPLPARLALPRVAPQSDFVLPVSEAPAKAARKEETFAKAETEEPAKPKADKPKPDRSKPVKVAKAEPEKTQTAKPRKVSVAQDEKPAAPSASNGSSAPQQGQKAKGGAKKVSPAAYAKAVLKKVRATPKKRVAAKGKAVVGFTVAGDGGLAGVTILKSSGNATLDQVALGHIRRSAPFPVPPEGAGRNFSFEFADR